MLRNKQENNSTLYSILKFIVFIGLLVINSPINTLSNLTQNDPFPYFSTMYPYDYLSLHERIVFEKLGTACFEEQRWNFSITPFYQWADHAIDASKNLIETDDLGGRTNVLAFFWDSYLRYKLVNALEITLPTGTCLESIINPAQSDPRKNFGFLSLPGRYRKGGFRFQAELKIWERCFDAVGLKAQFGIANIKQFPRLFEDRTCQSTAIACPVANTTESASRAWREVVASCDNPTAQPRLEPVLNPDRPPCANNTCCIFNRDCPCKTFVMENIMNQFDKISQVLGIDDTKFNVTEPEDLRLLLFWRHIKELNTLNPTWPRVLWVPFLEVGAGIPLTGHRNYDRLLALPFGNNGHASAGLRFGFSFDFIDVIEIATEGGFTKFFKQDICGLRLPTHAKESGIYPYKADVTLEPGNNGHFALTLFSRNFIDRLSVWAQYMFVNHSNDCVKICRSLIPECSDYYPTNPIDKSKISPDLNTTATRLNSDNCVDIPIQPDSCTNTPENRADVFSCNNLKHGFNTRRYEELTSWEVHMFNIAFNYDISPNVFLGILWQDTFNRRNAYCTNMLMFSVTATF